MNDSFENNYENKNILRQTLFSQVTIGKRVARNRFVANPMEMNCAASDGSPSEMVLKRYSNLARGRWGVIFVECCTAGVDRRSRFVGQNGLMLNEYTVNQFRKMMKELKKIDPDVLFVLQVSSGKIGTNIPLSELQNEEIQKLQDCMIHTCILAAEAGFDGVDFKQCHEFLPHKLIQDSNCRKDNWGGDTILKRSRFFIDAIRKIKMKLNRNYPWFLIGSRISEANLTNLHELVTMFESEGVDFINISAPAPYTFEHKLLRLISYAAKELATKCRVIGAGYDVKSEEWENVLSNTVWPDFFGFGRSSLRDPGLPQKVLKDSFYDINTCIGCDGCLNLLTQQQPVSCLHEICSP